MSLELRPYQRAAEEAVERLLEERPAARAVVALPTGTGKTALGLSLAQRMGRTLWLAHTEELIEQPLRAWRALFRGEVGVVKAERDEHAASALVLACVDTACRPERLERLVRAAANGAGPFRLVVVDEAHHATAASYRRVLDAYPGVPVLGLTATPERTDRAPLGHVFTDGLAFRLPIAAAVDGGWLVPWVARRVALPEFDPSSIPTGDAGDFKQRELAAELVRASAAAAVARATADAVAEGRKAIVFCLGVEQARLVCARLPAACPAAWVCGETPPDERRRALRAYAAGELRALVNCMVLTEGFDDPATNAVVVARPTRSRVLYTQMVGRGLRTYPGKRDCLLVDLVGAHGAHGLVMADALGGEPEGFFGLEPTWPAAKPGGAPSDEEQMEAAVGPSDRADQQLRRFLAYASGRLDVEGVTTEATVRWLVAAPGACFALPGGDGGTVLVERAGEDGWRAVLEPRERGAPPRALSEVTSLELAQTVGENHARAAGAFRLADRDAGWRRRPPSDRLLAALDRWHVAHPPDVSAGQASDLLTLAIAGARYRGRAKRPVVKTGGGMWTDL